MINPNFMKPSDGSQEQSLAAQLALGNAILQLTNNPVAPAQTSTPTQPDPATLAAMLNKNGTPPPSQPVLDASMSNGQGPTMQNDTTLQMLTNPNQSAYGNMQGIMNTQNTANVPLYSFFPQSGGQY